jgi:hypothetical protein
MSVSSQQAQNSNSLQSFITALVTNAVLLSIEVTAFIVLKSKLERIYSPRTFLPPEEKRAGELPKGPWKWLPAVIMSPPKDIIRKNGLDAYMFLRFLKMLIRIFAVFTLLTWLIILPLDATAKDGAVSGLERFSWGNITSSGDQNRFIAHLLLTYFLTFFVLFMIRREMLHFVHMRHQFLISKEHSRLAQARTVLITSVPEELANERDLRQFASFVPGGVDRVWIYRDTKALNKLFEERQGACARLEAAESKVLRQAAKAWRKLLANEKKARNKQPKDIEKIPPPLTPPAQPTLEFLDSLVPPAKRPTHRTGLLGLFGEKVSTIEWCKNEIARLNAEIKSSRENIVKGKFLGSVFIRCNLQMGAHVLAQCVSHHDPLMMYDKWIEAHPRDIVWSNLDDGALETRSRRIVSWLATTGLILFWALPVAFVGTLSNVSSLCTKVSWLAWICKAPKPVPGIIQGVIPPALLAILFAVLPLILRGLAWFECIPRYSLISVSVYRRFFLFLLINGFLVVTLTSGITTVIANIIERPTQTVQELAVRLPDASVFFLTYMVAQGLSGAGSALIQLVPLIMHYVRKWFLGRTPRQAYEVTFVMPSADFGVILPPLSLLAAIGFAYSVISPIINVLALVTFMFFYIAWKFLLLQVFDQPDESETGGLYFPMAMSNLFAGLYIEQVCLAALYFLKISEDRASSLAEGILMLVLLVITFTAQIFIRRSFDPITNFLPMSLATKKMAARYARNRRKGSGIDDIEEVDLFSRDRIRSVRMSMRRRIKALPHRIHDEILPASKRFSGGAVKSVESEDGEKGDDRRADAIGNPELDGKTSEGPENAHESAYAEATGVHSAPPLTIPAGPSSTRTSTDSKSSKASKASKTSKLSKHSHHPTFMPPEPAGADVSDEGEPTEDEDEDALGAHAFDHPATYVEQPRIWVPRDTLKLSTLLVNELRNAGVDASDDGALMDNKGIVEVSGNPPDEEWSRGHDH